MSPAAAPHKNEEEPSPLSITELSLLEMTSDEYVSEKSDEYDRKLMRSPGQLLVTTKDAYIWAALIAAAVEHAPHIDADTFSRVFTGSIAEAKQTLMNYYATWEPMMLQRPDVGLADRIHQECSHKP